MNRTTLRVFMAAVLAGLGTMLVLLPLAAQSNPSASRSFSAPSVEPGEQMVVTIDASGYGSAGGVTETLPAGFTYESSSLRVSQVHVTGQNVRFTLQGDDSFTYVVTASMTEDTYTFSGTLRDFDKQDHDVGGESSVTVETAAEPTPSPTPTPVQGDPSASRSFSAETVEPGGSVTVTITATNYGQAGGVTETLPAGFTYESSSLSASQVTELSGNQVRLTLQGDTSFTYIVTASMTEDTYTFSGTLRDFEREDHDVGGESDVVVGTPAPAASRSLSPATVEPGGSVTVTITATNYGQAGGVTETLPAGFTYESSSLSASQVVETGRSVRFTLQGDTSFTYTVTASMSEDTYTFSGTLRDFEREDHDVGGTSEITVETPAPAASRSLDPATVEPGGSVTVTITATNYGQAGGVTETLPAGFTYESSSLSDSQVVETGRSVRFTLQGDTSFTYTVTASMSEDTYTFSGTLRDFEREDHDVGGASGVTVKVKPEPTPEPTATITDDVAPKVTWNVPQALVLNVRIRPISPITEDEVASYAIEKGQLPRVLRLDETTGVITGKPGRETSAATTVTIEVCDTSGNCASFDLRFPRVVDPTIVDSTPTPTLPRVPEPDLTGVTVGGAAPSTALQIALATAGGALLLGGAGIMAARRRARVQR